MVVLQHFARRLSVHLVGHPSLCVDAVVVTVGEGERQGQQPCRPVDVCGYSAVHSAMDIGDCINTRGNTLLVGIHAGGNHH
jgi:hypothetical protein